MQSIEEVLSINAGRALPIFLNGDTRKCLALFQSVLGKEPHVIAHCHTEFETSDLYREVLKNSTCSVPPMDAVLDVQDVTDPLDAAGYKWVVLAGLQRLPGETQKDLAFDVKVAFETAKLKFVIIGSFAKGNPLIVYNGDLCARIAEIKVL